jgi:hypothetical protein
MKEPTVLDYFKSKVHFWKKSELHFPHPEESEIVQLDPSHLESEVIKKPRPPFKMLALPWKVIGALLFALFAQARLEPPARDMKMGAIFYSIAAILFIWGLIKAEVKYRDESVESKFPVDPFRIKWIFFVFGVIFALLAALLFEGHVFNPVNLFLWLTSIILFLIAVPVNSPGIRERIKMIARFLTDGSWKITIRWYHILAILVIAIVGFFRVYRIIDVPLEMTSDHAEKLMDVQDILDGKYSTYFTRNTGREFFQFYLTTAVIALFHTGISFLSLKIGTVFAGLFALPFIYLLGREISGKRAGWLAFFFAGIAYWPNVISRVGLRFSLYPMFTAPAMYFLIRGLKRRNRADFIWSGIFLGLGLHGYSPIRIVPLLIGLIIILYILDRRNKGFRLNALDGFLLVAFFSLILFLPLLRYAVDSPEIFSYRSLTRISSLERPLPGNPLSIFLQNQWNGIRMYFVNDGSTWLHSVPLRPALDIVSASLLLLGILFLLYRSIRGGGWQEISLLLSIPILMLPSTLSLAFPEENPALNRTAGAIIPVFIIIGIVLDAIIRAFEEKSQSTAGKWLGWLLLLLLAWTSVRQNYRLVFIEYQDQYTQSAGNTTEMAKVIRSFADSIGNPDSAWVVGYPYWCDTRLVSINAGYPIKDYAIWPDQFESTKLITGPKLFILNIDDLEDRQVLQTMYPGSTVSKFISHVPGRDFWILFVPSAQTELDNLQPVLP